MNPCIVIQGPTSRGLDKILHRYDKKNTIISTWDHEKVPDGYLSVQTKMPEGISKGISQNLNLQALSTLKGCLLAKELGFDYVLKIREDIEIENPSQLLSLLDIDQYCFYSYISAPSTHQYLVDYIVGGEVNHMIDLWSIDEVNTNICAEEQLTLRLVNLLPKKEIQFLISLLVDNNIGCYWHKLKYDLRNNHNDPMYNTNHNPFISYPLRDKVKSY